MSWTQKGEHYWQLDDDFAVVQLIIMEPVGHSDRHRAVLEFNEPHGPSGGHLVARQTNETQTEFVNRMREWMDTHGEYENIPWEKLQGH